MDFNYKIIGERFDAEEELRNLLEAPLFAFDTETTGLNFKQDRLVGISFAIKDMAWYIQGEDALASLSAVVAKLFSNEKQWCVGHNIPFDMHFVREYFGIEIQNRIVDSMIAVHTVDENRPKGLKQVAQDLLGLDEDLPSFRQLLARAKERRLSDYEMEEIEFLSRYPAWGTPLYSFYPADIQYPEKPETFTIEDIPLRELGRYGALDARLTYDIMKKLATVLEQKGLYKVFLKYLMPLLKTIYLMEQRGLYLDVPLLEKLEEQYQEEILTLNTLFDQQVSEKMGPDFKLNPRSSTQITEYLFDIQQVSTNGLTYQRTFDEEIRRWVKGDYPSTDFTNLSRIILRGADFPEIETLIKYRDVHKVWSTYVHAFLAKHVGGRLYGGMNLAGTATGRLSCVPLSSEILTRNGWKFYNQVSVGEEVMGFDIQTQSYIWTRIRKIHIGEDWVGKIVYTKSHDRKYAKGFYATKNHKWIMRNFSGHYGYAESSSLPRNWDIVLQPSVSFPDGQDTLLTKEQAFILGWFITDGAVVRSGKKTIRHGMQLTLVKERSIQMMDGYMKQNPSIQCTRHNYGDKVYYYFSVEDFERIYEIFCEYSPEEVVLSMSKDTRKIMYEAMLEGDGSIRKGGCSYDRFGAVIDNDKESDKYFELLSVSLGVSYTAPTRVLKSGKEFVDYNILTGELLKTRNFAWHQEKYCKVWCPTTECGTWVMRQGYMICITGNSDSPNLQNIPSHGTRGADIKRSIIAPHGMKLINCDYSQLELRIVAHLSKSPIMIKIFNEDGDPHQMTADLLGIPRARAKNVNFGWLYGASHYAICNTIERSNFSITPIEELRASEESPRPNKNDAIEWLENFDKAYPYLAKFKLNCIKKAVRLGYVETMAGRRRNLPELQGSYRTAEDLSHTTAGRQAVNSTVQGCKSGSSCVATEQGQIAMKDLNPEKHTLITYSGTTNNYTVHNTGIQPVLRVITNRGTDYVTAQHRFFIYKSGELQTRRLSELGIGDCILAYDVSSSQEVGELACEVTSLPKELKKDIGELCAAVRNHFGEKLFTPQQRSLASQLRRGRGGSRESIGELLDICEQYVDVTLYRSFLQEDYGKILSIEPVGEMSTYDIEIFSEDHSYVGGGLLQHNSAADIMGWSMVKLDTILPRYGAFMNVQVHDEILIEVPEENAEEVSTIVKREMENTGEFFNMSVPLKADPKIADNWHDAH